METKHNVVDEAITHHREINKMDAINETNTPQESQSKKGESISNESNKGMSLDKSRAYQRTEILDTVKKLNNQGLFHQPVYLIKSPK